jgi:hypothetical protein
MSLPLLGMSLGRFGRFSGALILAFLATLNAMGIDYNYTQDFYAAWITVVTRDVMDIAGGAVGLCWSAIHPRRLLSGSQNRSAAAGKCSALLNCQRSWRVDDRDPALWTAL